MELGRQNHRAYCSVKVDLSSMEEALALYSPGKGEKMKGGFNFYVDSDGAEYDLELVSPLSPFLKCWVIGVHHHPPFCSSRFVRAR